MRLEMTVDKGKIYCAVVIRSGDVAPNVIFQSIHEKAIVESVTMFIQENKDAGGVWHLGSLIELNVQRIEAVG